MSGKTMTGLLARTCFLSLILPSFRALAGASSLEKTKLNGTSGKASKTENAKFVMESDGHKFVGSYEKLKICFQSETIITDIETNNLSVIGSDMTENTLVVDVKVKTRFSSLIVSFLSEETDELFITNNDFGAEDNSKLEDKAIYYLYSKGDFTYISSVSIDSAIIEAGDDPEAVHSASAIVPSPLPTDYLFDPVPVEFNGYRGTILWKDSDGHVYPLEGAKISIDYYSFNPQIIGTKVVYTDRNGHFNTDGLPLGSGIDSTFKLTLANSGVEVYRCDNSDDNETIGFENRKSEYTMSLTSRINDLVDGKPLVIQTESNGLISDFGAATNIFECLYYYYKYAMSLPNLDNIPRCSAFYPCQKDYSSRSFSSIDVPFYTGASKMIIVPAAKPNDEGIMPHQSWDLLGHEYGHHIGNCLCHQMISLLHFQRI